MISWQKLVTSIVMSSKNMVSPSAVPVRSSLRYAGKGELLHGTSFSQPECLANDFDRAGRLRFLTNIYKTNCLFCVCIALSRVFRLCMVDIKQLAQPRNTEEDWEHPKQRKDAPNYRFVSHTVHTADATKYCLTEEVYLHSHFRLSCSL